MVARVGRVVEERTGREGAAFPVHRPAVVGGRIIEEPDVRCVHVSQDGAATFVVVVVVRPRRAW